MNLLVGFVLPVGLLPWSPTARFLSDRRVPVSPVPRRTLPSVVARSCHRIRYHLFVSSAYAVSTTADNLQFVPIITARSRRRQLSSLSVVRSSGGRLRLLDPTTAHVSIARRRWRVFFEPT